MKTAGGSPSSINRKLNKNMAKFYITTPIYYINAPPHIGHSYTNIAADTIARFKRTAGDDVYFLTGTDEHGQKIAKSAKEAGLSEQEFSDRMASKFIELWKALDVSYDDFIRTTEPRHIKAVQHALNIMRDNGDIYLGKYEGWYCTPCESFFMEGEGDNNLCPDCKRPLERISEENYFLKLSKYQDWLIEHIKANPDFIKPVSRYNEVLSFLVNNKLGDLCVSRPRSRLSWGIDIPFSKEHVAYVWFDALINYISAIGYASDEAKFNKYWPADIQLIGKDIIRHHAVYWPIMLKSLGLKLPKTIFAHGWWMINQAKMSKSRGNAVNPLDMANTYGLDVYRYFLLRDVPFGLDGNFSDEAIIKRYNSDLANDLGNLVHRTATMIEKYYAGKVPAERRLPESPLNTEIEKLNTEVDASISQADFSLALEKIWVIINQANKFIEDTKPWNLVKEKKREELECFILLLVKVIRTVALSLSAVMPQAAGKISSQFDADVIQKGTPLFPRIIS